MRASARLLQHATRITLFTRSQCALCDDAKVILKRVWEKRPFEFKEVDVMAREDRQWRRLYQFETPVIHIRKATAPEDTAAIADEIPKLMHRFTEIEVEGLMDKAEKEI